MKKTTFALLFSFLLIFSFIFASCNTGQGMSATGETSDTTTSNQRTYEAMIRDLENQIIELQQSQYISEAENQQELTRLQNLLAELKGNLPSDSQASDTSTSDSSADTSSDTSENSSTALFSYTREGDTVIITGYSGEDRRLVIPTMIDGYAVTEIADSAFVSDKIQDIVIPEGVKKIGWFAFQQCTSLVSVTVPASVTSIGYSAFPSGTSSVTIYCHVDSFAQKYAQSYGLSYAII